MTEILTEGFDGSQREFMRCLGAASQCATLLELDYHSEQDKLISYISREERTFFWHSNAWWSNPAMYKSSLARLRRNYQMLVSKACIKMEMPAWIESGGLEVIIGNEFAAPRVVFTYGGSRMKPIKIDSYTMFSPSFSVFESRPNKGSSSKNSYL